MSKVRLVAYRKKIASSNFDTAYELDLQEAPNVSLNFQFADLKEPEKRKANYSQTFKLPFTKNNNIFFESWYNVNAESLVFDTQKRFSAVIYVGTISQFEGSLQLRAVYQKAGYYEVVVLSASADLFTNVGGAKLKDVFLLDDGTYSYDLNHTFTGDNVEKSWDGTATNFYSIKADSSQGPALKDPDWNIQKVMYPLTISIKNCVYRSGMFAQDAGSLRVTQSTLDNWPGFSIENGAIGLGPLMHIKSSMLTQLKPAIQIKELFKRIIAKAGFSYTSQFIDSEYFSKIFMTLGTQQGVPAPVVIQTPGATEGMCVVGKESDSTTYEFPVGTEILPIENMVWTADRNTPDAGYSRPTDPSGFWNTSGNYFIRTDLAMKQIVLQWRSKWTNVTNVETIANGNPFTIKLQPMNWNTNAYVGDPSTWVTASCMYGYSELTGGFAFTMINLEDVPVGVKHRILIDVELHEWMRDDTNQPVTFQLFAGKSFTGAYDGSGQDLATSGFNNMYNNLGLGWDGYGQFIYNKVVDVPSNIDSSITQKAFLKDVIERFNLVVLTDPDNPEGIIIEPYDTFIGSGTIKYWTDKLDTSKESIVKDTTLMQKKTVLFSDVEDIDLMNKALKDNAPSYNVWGKKEMVFPNDFAKGILKNSPIFAPFITQAVFEGSTPESGSTCNLMVNYALTYKENAETESGYDNVLEPTKPKLFYYSGTPTAFEADDPVYNPNNYWHMHYVLVENANTVNMVADGGWSDYIKAKQFTTFPKCSAYELSPTANLNPSNRSLFWGDVPPVDQGFSNFSVSSMSQKSLYNVYWRSYLNSIYNPEARVMECYMNLNEVDISNFSFSDEIFIKDSYWRILSIKNYQVGVKASCKVTLLKVLDSFDTTCPGCGQVIAGSVTTESGSSWVGTFGDSGSQLYVWCPETDPDCTPTNPADYILTSEECCTCNGGNWYSNAVNASGLSACEAFAGSPPVTRASGNYPASILQLPGQKSLITGKVNVDSLPFLRGSNTGKFSSPMLSPMRDDIIIKYTNHKGAAGVALPLLNGESHRVVLIGYTSGTTRGYAYAEGNNAAPNSITIPNNCNLIMKVKGIVTVIGGTSSTYTVGTTEGFAYHTAFKRIGDTVSQIETAGGVNDWRMKEVGANTCSLYIDADSTNYYLRFGLDDTQADTERVWQLSVDLDVNNINNMVVPLGRNYAVWEDGSQIELQNYSPLIWN